MHPETPHSVDTFDRLIVVANPLSTRGQAAAALAEDLRTTYKNIHLVLVEITSRDIAVNRSNLITALQEKPAGKSLIIVAGGDSSVHYIATALAHPDMPTSLRHTPFTPAPFGNANDFSASVHGKPAAKRPLSIFTNRKGRVIAVHPLEWHIVDPKGEITRHLAIAYGTIGATGKGAELVDDPSYRKQRKQYSERTAELLDMKTGAPSLWFPSLFTVTMQGKAPFEASEMQFVNSPVMVKHARYPIALEERAMHFGVVRSNSPAVVGLTTARMALGVPPGGRVTEPVVFTIQGEQPISAQVDGETFRIASGSTVTIGPAAKPVYVWATK